MSIAKKDLYRYYRTVNNELLCPTKVQKQIMDDLKNSVSHFLSSHPEATMDDVNSTFGTPQQIAASYVEELPTEELISKIKLRRKIFKGVIAIVGITALLCLALWVSAIVAALISVNNNSDPYIETYIEERP